MNDHTKVYLLLFKLKKGNFIFTKIKIMDKIFSTFISKKVLIRKIRFKIIRKIIF